MGEKCAAILAIDTSTGTFSIAIRSGQGFSSRRVNLGLRHGELLAAVINEELAVHELKAKDLAAIVCSKGPGSFTGLRIGMATAKGLAAPWDIPLISVSVFDAWALAVSRLRPHSSFLPLIDGRKRRYYHALYHEGQGIMEIADSEPRKLIPAVKETLSSLKTDSLILGGSDAEAFFPAHADLIESIAADIKGLKIELIKDNQIPAAAETMEELGRLRFEAGLRDEDDQGPDYFRLSQAEEDAN